MQVRHPGGSLTSMRRLRPFRRREQIALAVVAALLVIVAVEAGLRVRDARREAKAAVALLDRSRATLGPLLRFDTTVWPGREGYARLQEDLRGAEDHLRRTDERLG